MQSTAGETKHICYKGPLSMNDKLSADRNEHANKFVELTVIIVINIIITSYFQLLLLLILSLLLTY